MTYEAGSGLAAGATGGSGDMSPGGESRPSASHRGLSPFARRILVTATLLLLPVIVLAGAWPVGGVSAVGDDLIYYLPVRQYIGERIRAGELPLWDPLVSMGTTLAADPQSGLWYPFTYLFVFLPPLVAYGISIAFHFALAGGGMYRFLRSLRQDWRAAFLGAMAFEFCGYLVAHREHLTIHQAVAWMPWIFYFWQRFADRGRYRHFALAAGCFGLQLLVQHMQPSIIMTVVLSAYVAFMLWPRRRSIIWAYPLGMAVGAAIGAVQILPTWFHFAGSGRSTPAYYLFVENSWSPPSAMLLLFPMIFGTTTPNFLWTEKWYGISHLVEQWCYPSIAILVLVAASSALLRPPVTPFQAVRPRGIRARLRSLANIAAGCNRQVLFWWIACAIALVIALGNLSPLTWALLHVPVYRSLRVPARWILVWSFAWPVLASIVVTTILQQRPGYERLIRRMRWLGTRALPVAAGLCLVLIILSRFPADFLRANLPHWLGQPDWEGLKAAVRPGNAALWWPPLMMVATVWLLLWWARKPASGRFAVVFGVCLLDLASLAAFVGVDTRSYHPDELTHDPPLAADLRKLDLRPGERLLVPRTTSSYYQPLQVLWPLSNLPRGIPTLNGYGPLWSPAQRQLFRFMAWGASEEMLALLRNPDLLQAMGVRFLAVRSEEERRLIAGALAEAVPNPDIRPIPGTEQMAPISWWSGALWPVEVDQPGIYQLELDASPVEGSTSRWFVRLESDPYHELDTTRCLEPIDLALGPRRMRFLFVSREAPGNAFVRVKSEVGQALLAGHASFGRVADLPPPGASFPAVKHPFHFRGMSSEIDIYELPHPTPLVWLAGSVEACNSLPQVIDRLLRPTSPLSERCALVESTAGITPGARSSAAELTYERRAGHRLVAQVKSPTEQLLVFNESYDQGWQATIDGRPADKCRINAVCQGVVVPPGRHDVEFTYRAKGLVAGAFLSGGSFSLLLLSVLASVWTGSRRARSAGERVLGEKSSPA